MSLRATVGGILFASAALLGAIELARAEPGRPPERPGSSASLGSQDTIATQPAMQAPQMPCTARVVDARTRDGIVGATLELSTDDRQVGAVVSGERGVARFDRLEPEPATFVVLARAPGYAPAHVTWTKPARGFRWPGTFTVSLEPGSPDQAPRRSQGQLEDVASWASDPRAGEALDRIIDRYLNGPIAQAYQFTPQQREKVRTRLEEMKVETLRVWQETAIERWELRAKGATEGVEAARRASAALKARTPLINEQRALDEIEKLLPEGQVRIGRERYAESKSAASGGLMTDADLRRLPGEGSRLMTDPNGWAEYVDKFCSLFELHEDQLATADSVRREAQARRDQYIAPHQAEIGRALHDRPHELLSLFTPVETIWSELRDRLDQIPTLGQLESMKQKSPGWPATTATEYLSARSRVGGPSSTAAASAGATETRPNNRPLGWILTRTRDERAGYWIDTGGMYHVSGAVPYPGPYRIRPGQRLTLREALMATGGQAGSEQVQIEIHRGPTESVSVSLADITGGSVPEPLVQPNDLIRVRPANTVDPGESRSHKGEQP